LRWQLFWHGHLHDGQALFFGITGFFDEACEYKILKNIKKGKIHFIDFCVVSVGCKKKVRQHK
jgi:hypothetical protein